MAVNSLLYCSEDGCGKPHLYHTDYLYHANGCIEIKYLEDSNNAQEPPRKQLERAHTTYVHMYCHKCGRNVQDRAVVPIEMLEMSFYKFLEQFFYNKKITVS